MCGPAEIFIDNTFHLTLALFLFRTALELESEERAAFLNRSCDGNEVLRNQIEKLLASHHDAGAFLDSPALVDAGLIATEVHLEGDSAQALAGQRIGPYEIVREIGRGGMGTV